MLPTRLFRLTAWALISSGILIVIKKLAVDLLLPVRVETNLVGTSGLLIGLFALTGAYLWQYKVSGTFGLVAYLVNWFGLGLASGADYARNYIFPFMSASERQALLAGPTRLILLASALAFLLGVILFSIATLRANVFHPVPIVMYMIGFTLFSLSFALPDIVARGGEVFGALGVLWWGIDLAMRVRQPAGMPQAPGQSRESTRLARA
jgi:hypothetical protein